MISGNSWNSGPSTYAFDGDAENAETLAGLTDRLAEANRFLSHRDLQSAEDQEAIKRELRYVTDAVAWCRESRRDHAKLVERGWAL